MIEPINRLDVPEIIGYRRVVLHDTVVIRYFLRRPGERVLRAVKLTRPRTPAEQRQEGTPA